MEKKIKRIVIKATMAVTTGLAYSKEGGLKIIKINQIRMKSHQIILKGQDANNIQKIIPVIARAITSLLPDLNANCTISIYPRPLLRTYEG